MRPTPNSRPATDSTAGTGPPTTAMPYQVLIWLAVATFSTGIDGYVLAGLLPTIAADLGVSEAAAGQLVSVFALTAAVAAPILGAATGSWERRRTIAWSLAVFVIGNVITALAANYPVALSGRIVAALGASLLNAAISSYVIQLVGDRHRGRALSFVLGGWMTATALGVPVGLILGQTSWRFPLIMVATVGTVALIGIMIKLAPLTLPRISLRARLRPLRQPRLVAGLAVTTGILCASYCCFTFAVLILGPAHPEPAQIILIMFGYGLASLIGNLCSGRLADRFGPVRVLTLILIGLSCTSLIGVLAGLLPLAGAAVIGLVWFFAAGVGNGGAAVPQQARLATMAPDSAPVLMALNGSAIALGSALGGGLGGVALAGGLRPTWLPLLALIILVATLALHLRVAHSSRGR